MYVEHLCPLCGRRLFAFTCLCLCRTRVGRLLCPSLSQASTSLSASHTGKYIIFCLSHRQTPLYLSLSQAKSPLSTSLKQMHLFVYLSHRQLPPFVCLSLWNTSLSACLSSNQTDHFLRLCNKQTPPYSPVPFRHVFVCISHWYIPLRLSFLPEYICISDSFRDMHPFVCLFHRQTPLLLHLSEQYTFVCLLLLQALACF